MTHTAIYGWHHEACMCLPWKISCL